MSTWRELRERNTLAGQHWFEPATMKSFASRLEGQPYAGDVFVTSEQDPGGSPRRFTVRRMSADGRVSTIGAYQQHATLDDARRAARLHTHELRETTAE